MKKYPPELDSDLIDVYMDSLPMSVIDYHGTIQVLLSLRLKLHLDPNDCTKILFPTLGSYRVNKCTISNEEY